MSANKSEDRINGALFGSSPQDFIEFAKCFGRDEAWIVKQMAAHGMSSRLITVNRDLHGLADENASMQTGNMASAHADKLPPKESPNTASDLVEGVQTPAANAGGFLVSHAKPLLMLVTAAIIAQAAPAPPSPPPLSLDPTVSDPQALVFPSVHGTAPPLRTVPSTDVDPPPESDSKVHSKSGARSGVSTAPKRTRESHRSDVRSGVSMAPKRTREPHRSDKPAWLIEGCYKYYGRAECMMYYGLHDHLCKDFKNPRHRKSCSGEQTGEKPIVQPTKGDSDVEGS